MTDEIQLDLIKNKKRFLTIDRGDGFFIAQVRFPTVPSIVLVWPHDETDYDYKLRISNCWNGRLHGVEFSFWSIEFTDERE